MRTGLLKELNKLPPTHRVAAANKFISNTYQRSLGALAREGLGYKDVNPKTHRSMIRLLQDESKRKLICVPRGCLKSSIACVAYPIWLLINNPNLRVLIDSELWTNSTTFIREIKQHLEGDHLTSLFGEFRGSTWNSDELIIKQRTKNLKEASITASGIGAIKVGQHYDVIIFDDLNSPQNTSNPEQAQKVIQHYKMSTSILEPNGTMVLIGTRYAMNDCIGYILENEEIELIE